jgi:hypothetical protein
VPFQVTIPEHYGARAVQRSLRNDS